jgi:hypothetical protein
MLLQCEKQTARTAARTHRDCASAARRMQADGISAAGSRAKMAARPPRAIRASCSRLPPGWVCPGVKLRRAPSITPRAMKMRDDGLAGELPVHSHRRRNATSRRQHSPTRTGRAGENLTFAGRPQRSAIDQRLRHALKLFRQGGGHFPSRRPGARHHRCAARRGGLGRPIARVDQSRRGARRRGSRVRDRGGAGRLRALCQSDPVRRD